MSDRVLNTLMRSLSWGSIFVFSKPLFTQKEKLNIKIYNSTLPNIYRISVGEKLKKH